MFDQECTNKLRSDLATLLDTVNNLFKYQLPRSIIRGCFPALLAVDNTEDDASFTVLGVSQNTESASAESSPSAVEVIMDGASIAEESANVAELSPRVVEVVLDGAATNEEEFATNAAETSPSVLKLLIDMLSPQSKRRAKREGTALKFEVKEKQTHISMLAMVTAQSKEAQKSQGQCQHQGQEEQQQLQEKAMPIWNCMLRMKCSATL
jgi:hypothetical protein